MSTAKAPVTYSGAPSPLDSIVILILRAVNVVLGLLRLPVNSTKIASLIARASPPRNLSRGKTVHQSDYNGWKVWIIRPEKPTGQYVVAIHGGAFVVEPIIIHWRFYFSIARDTRATVIVPIYRLAPEGTAATEVPQMADFISSLIDIYGAQRVSVVGDSAGGTIALAATKLLVTRGSDQPLSSVLISPAVDLRYDNPDITLVDDPVLDVEQARECGLLWAAGLELDDPLVSPLAGSLEGLPPTYVYSGSAEILAPDHLLLQDKAIEQNADVVFVLKKGAMHNWAMNSTSVRAQIYRTLTEPRVRDELA